MVVLLASLRAYFLSKIHGLKIHGGSAGYLCRLSLWVRPYVPMCVRMWHGLLVEYKTMSENNI